MLPFPPPPQINEVYVESSITITGGSVSVTECVPVQPSLSVSVTSYTPPHKLSLGFQDAPSDQPKDTIGGASVAIICRLILPSQYPPQVGSKLDSRITLICAGS